MNPREHIEQVAKKAPARWASIRVDPLVEMEKWVRKNHPQNSAELAFALAKQSIHFDQSARSRNGHGFRNLVRDLIREAAEIDPVTEKKIAGYEKTKVDVFVPAKKLWYIGCKTSIQERWRQWNAEHDAATKYHSDTVAVFEYVAISAIPSTDNPRLLNKLNRGIWYGSIQDPGFLQKLLEEIRESL